MENKKKIIMVVLSVLVCVMAVGYAVLAQQLNINGKISIDSTWKVEITNITEKDIVGDASSKVEPTYTATTANFSVGLIQPGDSITYDIEVTNSGTLDAILEDINVSLDENDAITYTTSGLKIGDKLSKNGGKNTLSIKVEYNPNVTSQPTNTGKGLTVTINYEQDLGQTIYDSYSIGDVVSFAGSDWYVIQNSSNKEDYVTLLKETVLTKDELGEYAAKYTRICTRSDVNVGRYGCTTIGQKLPEETWDTMLYYWSDTCHGSGYYGYTEWDDSGCAGHEDYEGSKIKEYLEGTYINTLGEENLKEVDGYRIRLLNKGEMSENLGYDLTRFASAGEYYATDNVPTWVYQGFGGGSYWTMIIEYGPSARYINETGYSKSSGLYGSTARIRPVINLLKSSI